MRIKTLLLTTTAAALLTGGGLVLAQQEHQHDEQPQAPQGMTGHHGMMGGGMMNMMERCERMMGGMRGGHAMPHLPPGNEKLQLQMHAEMMQRMGEILAKYAAQAK